MTNKLALCYLVEGTPEPFHIFVRNDPNDNPMVVDDLRRTIFEDVCKLFADSHSRLTLLKVSILVVTISAVKLTLFLSSRSMWTRPNLGTTCPYYDSTKMMKVWKNYLPGDR